MTFFFPLCIVFQCQCDFGNGCSLKKREADGVQWVKVSSPKFKNRQATVRNVRIKKKNFGKRKICTYKYISNCLVDAVW